MPAYKIVITDGYTLNPGDLNWEGIRALGEITYYDRTAPAQVLEICKDADVIITNKTPITKEVIAAATQLKVIAVAATGYNVVDGVAARTRQIPVCNVPEYGTYSVAQHTWALLLELTNHVGVNMRSVALGEWSASLDFCYSKLPLIELAEKTIGIVGMGRIGQQVATIAQAMGMNVLYHARQPKPNWPHCVSLNELFERSDVISLHCPQTADNIEFVNASLLSRMKRTAFLINTSRGLLINETDLANTLKENKISGAALDVLSKEPPLANHPLIGLPNCIITPHNAWLSKEARNRIMETTVKNIAMALQGKPQHVVNL